MTNTELLREKIFNDCGVCITMLNEGDMSFLVTEWCWEFEQLMRNGLSVGAVRYGRMGDPQKPKYDLVKAITDRIRKYAKTGNTVLLVDVANLAMLEFIEGDHPNKHFDTNDGTEHIKEATI